MNAPVFPANPAIGDRWMNWVWNGARWVCNPMAGMQVIQTVMTATGPYQPSPGLVTVVVEALGGGGGGGGAVGDQATTAVNGWMMGGGGGGGGAYSRSALAASLVLGGVIVTVGVGGQPGSGVPPYNASDGTLTSFGSFVVAPGGKGGGTGAAGNQFGQGGLPAGVGVGQLALPGSGGQAGIAYYWDGGLAGGTAMGGMGGGTYFGGSGSNVGVITGGSAVGANGAPGAGGDGGASGLLSLPVLGGLGGRGLCIVTEYCWADVADEDCGCGSTGGMARVARYGQGGPWPGGFDD
jgi:hypothetical protein